MTYSLEFQRNVLKFILVHRDGGRWFKILHEKLFDEEEISIIYSLVRSYYNKYKELPSKINLNEYLFQKLRSKATDEQIRFLQRELTSLFVDIPDDVEYIKEQLVRFAQSQKIKNLFQEYGQRILGDSNTEIDDEVFESLRDEMIKVVDIQKSVEGDVFANYFILRDYEHRSFLQSKPHPHFIECLNRNSPNGGIISPMICVLIGAAKGSKTTFMINTAVHYARSGLQVLYLDTENGYDRINQMLYQNIVGCTVGELLRDRVRKVGVDFADADVKAHIRELLDIVESEDGYDEGVRRDAISLLYQLYYDRFDDRMVKVLPTFEAGGEIKVEYNPQMTLNDVRSTLNRLKHDHGFVPSVIICDYVDKMVDLYSRTPNNLQLQGLYNGFKGIISDLGAFMWTPSQVNRDGQENEKMSSKYISGDIGKKFNADLIVALSRTEEEERTGYGRFSIDTFRQGSKHIPNYPNGYPMLVDNARCIIRELTEEEIKKYIH